MALWLMSTSRFFSAGAAAVPTGNRSGPQLTAPRQSETVGPVKVWMGSKMRIGTAALSVAFAGVFALLADAQAQTAPQGMRTAQASPADELFTQPPVRRPPRRLRIYPRYQAEPDGVYPRYFPGPDAVRVCNATYVQEFRPSGTVLVPRMSCTWRRG
jgi:hypothetical protein